MIGQELRNALAPVLVITAIGLAGFTLVRCLVGCTPAQQLTAENAAAVASYDAELVRCKAAAKLLAKAERFEAFVECEEKVAVHLCAESEELRKTWPHCSEVTHAR